MPNNSIPFQWKLARTFALSYRNKRGLEDKWYPLWERVFADLTPGRKDFLVTSQYSFYYDRRGKTDLKPEKDGAQDKNSQLPDASSSEDEDDEDDEDDGDGDASGNDSDEDETPCDLQEMEPRSREIDIHISRRAEEDDDDDCNPVGIEIKRDDQCHMGSDISDISARTVHNKNCSTKIPDLAILHLCACPGVEFEDADDFYRRLTSNMKITHECSPLFAEIKTAISRLARGWEIREQLAVHFEKASEQTLHQCQHYFRSYKRASAVYTIIAVGSYWRYKLVHWRDVIIETPGDHEVWKSTGWTDFFEIGSADSQRAMRHLSEALENLPYVMGKHSMGRCVLAPRDEEEEEEERGESEAEVRVEIQDDDNEDDDSEDEIFTVKVPV